MEEKPGLIRMLYQKTEQYIKTTLELYKLKAIDKSADLISGIVAWTAIVLASLLFFLFINIAIALWIGDLLGKSYYGFFVLAGLYVLIGVILYIFRATLIKKPVSNSVINNFLND